MREASFYEKLDKGRVRCTLCPHRCVIKEGQRGVCGVRENRNTKLFTLVYRKAVSLNLDPIEKKPFFHFLPASYSLSLATVGCNMHCIHCQNYSISQIERTAYIPGEDISPEEIVRAALAEKALSISYTYTEPTIFYEYAFETMKIAHTKGIKNCWVTNGYISKNALSELLPVLDAANVDLKAFNEPHYHKICGGNLRSVLKTIEAMHKNGVWVEVTTLLIPGLNDSENELRKIARFILALSPDVPWHISRFHPTYKMTDRGPTPASSIKMAREIGRDEGLHFVYAGNVWGDEGENTFCFNCAKKLITRHGFSIGTNLLKDGRCPECGIEIKGVWL